MRFGVEVQTPGLPANMRRLGDLRLQCQVMIAIGKKELNLALRVLVNTVLLGSDWCASKHMQVTPFLVDWSISNTLVYGGKRQSIPVNGYRLFAPVHDKSLPDDALVELEFWSQASLKRKQEFLAQRPLYLKSSVNKWKEGVAFHTEEDARYRAVIQIKPGKWKFSLQSEGKELVLAGSAKDAPAALGREVLLKYHGPDLVLNVEQAAAYEFLLNLQNPDHPVLTIRQVEERS
jgi:hypothetical protein